MLETSKLAKTFLESQWIEPQLILEIDGLPTIASSGEITREVYVGQLGLLIGDTWNIGQSMIDKYGVEQIINLSASSNTITQQLSQERTGSGSNSSYKIKLVDYGDLVTRWISPGVVIDEILAKKARLYLSFKGLSHPEDSVLFHKGLIETIESEAGAINITIASEEQQKRYDIFQNIQGTLTANITASQTTIPVDTTNGLLLPNGSSFTTFVRIGDEIIQYTGLTPTSLTGCTRGALTSLATTHNADDDYSSIYGLGGNAIDLALQLMMSGSPTNYLSGVSVLGFNTYGTETLVNVLFVDLKYAKTINGITQGDQITITGAANPANNGTFTVAQVYENGVYSGLLLTSSLITEGSGATFSASSPYNALPDGLGMTPDQVDVQKHRELQQTYSAYILDYQFYLDDTIQGNEFINKEIYFPTSCFQIPRKTRASVGITAAPTGIGNAKFFDKTNIINPSKIKTTRSLSKYFYNSYQFRYEEDPVDKKFLRGIISLSADSTNRIKLKNKTLKIDSRGVRENLSPEPIINAQAVRYLQRFQFGAETIEIQTQFADGFQVEIGDLVILDGDGLNISDTKNNSGTRDFAPRIMEVINKVLNVKAGNCQFTLLDTSYNGGLLDGRFGVISQSSIIGSGSTTTSINLNTSYSSSLDYQPNEQWKWDPYVGQTIQIRSEDYSFIFETKIVSIVGNVMTVSPALPSPPLAGYIIEIANYPTSTDPLLNRIWKFNFVFWNPQVQVVSATASTIDVSALDISKFNIDCVILVHNDDYSNLSQELTVKNISGNTLILSENLSYLPVIGDKIELIGFADSGAPYRFL